MRTRPSWEQNLQPDHENEISPCRQQNGATSLVLNLLFCEYFGQFMQAPRHQEVARFRRHSDRKSSFNEELVLRESEDVNSPSVNSQNNGCNHTTPSNYKLCPLKIFSSEWRRQRGVVAPITLGFISVRTIFTSNLLHCARPTAVMVCCFNYLPPPLNCHSRKFLIKEEKQTLKRNSAARSDDMKKETSRKKLENKKE